ncbi:MAG: methyltransferase domain-containing protein [Candidatus Pacearchaeota archaeon]
MKKEVYWPRVIKIDKEKIEKNPIDEIKNKIMIFIEKVKDNNKRAMLESVYLNNIFYTKTIDKIKLLFNILKSMDIVDRKFFVLDEYKNLVYMDTALPIGHDQTISQPTTVARMLLLLFEGIEKRKGKIEVYEIGSGSGWNAALIAYLLKIYKKNYNVYSVDRIQALINFATKNIKKFENEKKIRLNLKLICEDGFIYANNKKFDYIIFTAGIPNKYIEEKVRKMANKNLKQNGRLIAPETYGGIFIFEKEKEKIKLKKTQETYAFVPLLEGKIL